MLVLYRIVSTVLLPGIWLWLLRRRSKGKEHRTRMAERLGYPSASRPQGKLFWIHAASVGEFNAAVPLIIALQNNFSLSCVLVTTGTVTSATLAEKYTSKRVLHQFVPVDAWPCVVRFLSHWQPNVAIWMESELWPNLVHETHRRGSPILLVNARMSEKSAQRWQRYRAFFTQMMRCFCAVFPASDTDAQRYASLGVQVQGSHHSIKYDAQPPAIDKDFYQQLHTQIKDRPRWLAASTHAGEEEQVLRVHRQIQNTIPNIVTIIVPRHPHRADDVEALCRQQGYVAQRCSDNNAAGNAARPDIIIGDVMGQMGSFFRVCPVVLMGGSLVPQGGHNPIEPAQMGCAIICGPYMFHFADMVQQWRSEDALVQVQESAQLATQICAWLEDDASRKSYAMRAQEAVNKRTGMVVQVMQHLIQLSSATHNEERHEKSA